MSVEEGKPPVLQWQRGLFSFRLVHFYHGETDPCHVVPGVALEALRPVNGRKKLLWEIFWVSSEALRPQRTNDLPLAFLALKCDHF